MANRSRNIMGSSIAGWYVVKATRVERYEILFTDFDEEGFEARYYNFWKESHEDFAMVNGLLSARLSLHVESYFMTRLPRYSTLYHRQYRPSVNDCDRTVESEFSSVWYMLTIWTQLLCEGSLKEAPSRPHRQAQAHAGSG